jgi:hypothetical protein
MDKGSFFASPAEGEPLLTLRHIGSKCFRCGAIESNLHHAAFEADTKDIPVTGL